MSKKPQITIVIPLYNEEKIIAITVEKVITFLTHSLFPYEYELVLANNASSDSSLSICRNLCLKWKQVKCFNVGQKGKGRAIRLAWSESKADVLVFMDADLASDLNYLLPLVNSVLVDGNDLAIGSRLGKSSKVLSRRFYRKIASHLYNLFIRIFLKSKIIDHQCGFKAIKNEAFKILLPYLTDNAWFFDTELLMYAQKYFLKITTIDIVWIDRTDSKVSLGRTSRDMFNAARSLKRRLQTEKFGVTRICYFGIYKSDFSRNQIYIKGLRKNGVTVIECQDYSQGLQKYLNLFLKHWKLRRQYDVMIVGYPGHIMVPFAKLVTSKPVVADLLGSLQDAGQHSHNARFFRDLKNKIVDWLAVRCADIVLLESEAQKNFFISRYGESKKYRVVYTGADDEKFSFGQKAAMDKFSVLFRGSLTPESGIFYILDAAELLKKNRYIRFLIIGRGKLLEDVRKRIQDKRLDNINLISEYLPDLELREKMQEADLSLGQFEDNPRLNRTIPHKAFESFSLGIPYLTGDSLAMREIGKDGEMFSTCPLASSKRLAGKIEELSRSNLLPSVAKKANDVFKERFSPEKLARDIISVILHKS